MFSRFLAAAALCLITSAAPAKTILWDEGGLLNDRGREIHGMILQGETVRIIGICLSSCTMYLSVPGVCVHKNAVLMFHGPYNLDGPITPQQYSAGVEWMADYYPSPIDDWFRVIGHTRSFWMKGSALFSHGVQECR